MYRDSGSRDGAGSCWQCIENLDLETDLGLGKPGPLLGLLQLLLCLPELGQVEGGDLLSLFDLLLVGLDLGLQLAGQGRHLLLVLVVFVNRKLDFLAVTLRLLVSLAVLASVRLEVAQLSLHLSDPSLQFGHRHAASADCILACLGILCLHLGELGFKSTLLLHQVVGVVLLHTKLISKASSIHHSLLGLLLGALGLDQKVIYLGMHCMDSSLSRALVA